jgi:multidrug transporter EmrE-like cation transporter
MTSLSGTVVVTFIISVIAQLTGAGLLPKTQGFTHFGYSLASLTMIGIGAAAMARLIRSGIGLSILVPTVSTVIPLVSILIGVVAYGETVSLPRVSLLIVACGVIGLASKF